MSDTRPGVCEICGQRSLFANEFRCAFHPLLTAIVVRLANGETVVLGRPESEAP